ncbi:hypothetical protein CLJ1_3939 [Pseudomonas paraeruginosa]|nr:hypothetical protein CLJ1_3939 [Pseudomonas aeruginosa]
MKASQHVAPASGTSTSSGGPAIAASAWPTRSRTSSAGCGPRQTTTRQRASSSCVRIASAESSRLTGKATATALAARRATTAWGTKGSRMATASSWRMPVARSAAAKRCTSSSNWR